MGLKSIWRALQKRSRKRTHRAATKYREEILIPLSENIPQEKVKRVARALQYMASTYPAKMRAPYRRAIDEEAINATFEVMHYRPNDKAFVEIFANAIERERKVIGTKKWWNDEKASKLHFDAEKKFGNKRKYLEFTILFSAVRTVLLKDAHSMIRLSSMNNKN
jgi:hypothetical protein